nr:hypothetical protein [Amylibacter sp.]
MTNALKAVGGEILVNSFTNGDQTSANIGFNPKTGGFQIVWQSEGQDGDGWGVFAQNFNAKGKTVGAEIQVNTITIGDQTTPDVAFNEDGNGMWIWQSNAQLRTGLDREDDPTALDAVTSIRTHTKSFGFEGQDYYNVEKERHGGHIPDDEKFSLDPQLISLGGDQFGSGSRDNDIARGGSQYLVDEFSAYTPSIVPRNGDWSRNFAADEINPRGQTTFGDIGKLDDENILVVSTMTSDFDGSMGIIQFQTFERPDGERERGLAFKTSARFELEGSGLTGPAFNPRVAMLKDGGFAITWMEEDQSSANSGKWHYDSYVQIFNQDLTARSSVVDVHDANLADQTLPEITATKDGGFVIAYTTSRGENVVAQRFDDTGIRIGEAQLINKTKSGDQSDVSLTTLKNGKVVVTWESDEGSDGDGSGIYAQMLNLLGTGAKVANHFVGTSANEKFSTGAKNDFVDGGAGRDVIKGGGGKDKLLGGDGADKILGGGGNDYIDGGAGNDRLSGNQGNDTFVFNGGKDVITDYNKGDNALVFDRSLGDSGRLTMKKLKAFAESDGDDLVFDFGKDELTLKDVSNFASISDDISFI